MNILDHLTDAPRNKRELAHRIFLCTCLGDTCTHKRDVEDAVREAILAGHIIVSDGRGYRRTDDLEEVERYIASLEHRRDSLTERVGALRKAMEARKSPVEQETLWAA